MPIIPSLPLCYSLTTAFRIQSQDPEPRPRNIVAARVYNAGVDGRATIHNPQLIHTSTTSTHKMPTYARVHRS
ncbi:hypothetical protein O988_08972 [Pseudogymnoascus sp. VKM F-3808]|nr:hypothetical protein O988_08972 [Pseudogymnoascus sp. VKM F-3808]